MSFWVKDCAWEGKNIAVSNARKSRFDSGDAPAHGPDTSGDKLVETFLADLESSWQRNGREVLKRLGTERPRVYFKAMVKLTQALHRRLPVPPEFDRRHYRADVLQRLQQRTGNVKQ